MIVEWVPSDLDESGPNAARLGGGFDFLSATSGVGWSTRVVHTQIDCVPELRDGLSKLWRD
jgi:hypothetical protein